MRAYNITGATISVGQAVHVNGATSGLPTIVLSLSNPDLNATVNGVANENIPNGQIGQIITNGIITGVDTTSLVLTNVNPGDALYLSDVVPGKYSTNYFGLSYSSRANVVGYVIATGSNGSIYVSVNNENLNLSITVSATRTSGTAGSPVALTSATPAANTTLSGTYYIGSDIWKRIALTSW